MIYFAVKVWQPVKQTVAPKESCLYVFDQCFHSYFIFLNSKDIFLAYKQLTCLQKLYLTSKNPLKNILLSENKSSRQQLPTPNFEYLVAKHVLIGCKHESCLHPVRICFFLMCTSLDATDGICYCATKHWLIKNSTGDAIQWVLIEIEVWNRLIRKTPSSSHKTILNKSFDPRFFFF